MSNNWEFFPQLVNYFNWHFILKYDTWKWFNYVVCHHYPDSHDNYFTFIWILESLYIDLGFIYWMDWNYWGWWLLFIVDFQYTMPHNIICKLQVIKSYTMFALYATLRDVHIFYYANQEIYLICNIIKVLAVQILYNGFIFFGCL